MSTALPSDFPKFSQSLTVSLLHKGEQSSFSATAKKNSHFPIQCFASFIMLSLSLPLPWGSGDTHFLLNLNVLLYLASVLRSETSISLSNQITSHLDDIASSFSNLSYCLLRVLLSNLKSKISWGSAEYTRGRILYPTLSEYWFIFSVLMGKWILSFLLKWGFWAYQRLYHKEEENHFA